MADGGEENKQEEKTNCPVCGSPGEYFPCSACGAIFCINCQGIHVPPAPATLISKVQYRYRMRSGGDWKEDIAKFQESIGLKICPSCYESEFDKAIMRLKWKVKEWKTELQRDEDVFITSESVPEKESKEKILKIARDFLATQIKAREGG